MTIHPSLISYRNYLNYSKFFFWNTKAKLLLAKTDTVNSLLVNKLLYDKNNNLIINNNFSKVKYQNIFSDETSSISSLFTKKNLSINNFLLNMFFLFNYSMFNSNFKVHHMHNFLHVSSVKNKTMVVHLPKLLFRWKNTYDLFFNIFYYNLNYLLFSTPFFKAQALSFNWSSSQWNLSLWRYYSPFFLFQPNRYNKKIDFFFKKLKKTEIDFVIITDCVYHYKNIFYLKKSNYYTIGLISVYDSPWLVSYPVISFFDNYLIQLFFFKLLVIIQKQAFYFKYNLFKKTWNTFFINKNLLKL